MWLLDSLCLRSNLSQQPCLHALDYVCAVQHAAEACRAFNESAISLSADHCFMLLRMHYKVSLVYSPLIVVRVWRSSQCHSNLHRLKNVLLYIPYTSVVSPLFSIHLRPT